MDVNITQDTQGFVVVTATASQPAYECRIYYTTDGSNPVNPPTAMSGGGISPLRLRVTNNTKVKVIVGEYKIKETGGFILINTSPIYEYIATTSTSIIIDDPVINLNDLNKATIVFDIEKFKVDNNLYDVVNHIQYTLDGSVPTLPNDIPISKIQSSPFTIKDSIADGQLIQARVCIFSSNIIKGSYVQHIAFSNVVKLVAYNTSDVTLNAPIITDSGNNKVTIINPNSVGSIIFSDDNTDPKEIDYYDIWENKYNDIERYPDLIIRARIKYGNLYSEETVFKRGEPIYKLQPPIIEIKDNYFNITNPNSLGLSEISSSGEVYVSYTSPETKKLIIKKVSSIIKSLRLLPYDDVSFKIINCYDVSEIIHPIYSNNIILQTPIITENNRVITINADVYGNTYYTIDYDMIGINPNDITKRIKYTTPFSINMSCKIEAITEYNGYYSKTSTYTYNYTYNPTLDDNTPYIELTGGEDKVLENKVINKNYIDIINNTDYETIKVLNSVSYILSSINKFYICPKFAEEDLNRLFSGDEMFIYTDETKTGIFNININNDKNGFNAYKLPYYDRGKWNFNYFRNNITDNPTTKEEKNRTYSDNHSLIYGKYFVVRFIFNNNVRFKLDTLDFNKQEYYEK